MKYTHRTILRHLVVVVVLLYFPFALRPTPEVWNWYANHIFYFISLFSISIFIGLLSHFLVTRKIPVIFILSRSLKNEEQIQKYQQGQIALKNIKMSYYLKQVAFFTSCSRCLSWWFGGFIVSLISYMYWPSYVIWWHTVIMLIFFSVLAGSIAALVSVLTYFMKKNKKSFSD